MALPKSKYSKAKHTPGKEFTLNGVDYRGWFIVTYQDKYFTGKTLTEESKQLFPVNSEPTLILDIFVSQEVSPTDQDYNTGVWERYLLQNRKSRAIIEVSKARYDAFKTSSNTARVKIKWVIKGPVQDITKGNYVYRGAESQNKLTVSKLESTIPGITNYFKDYAEFVE